MRNILAENMRRFNTKNLNEDSYSNSQAEDRLAKLAHDVFQEASNHKSLTPELIAEEPGYYRIIFTKPGRFLKKEKTGWVSLFLDQNPDTFIMRTIINGEEEGRETFNWGEGLFATGDDDIYKKAVREVDRLAMHLMEK
jgi:hypothetical protein